MSLFDTIKKPSSPYPETYIGYPVDQDDWSAYQFIDYYEANMDLVGKAQAIQYLGQDIKKLNSFADIYDSKFDCYVLRYFTNEIGQDFPTLLGYATCGVQKATSSIMNVGNTVNFITKPGVLITAGILVAGVLTYPYWRPVLKRKKRGRV